MNKLIVLMILLILGLQYKLWVGDGSLAEIIQLKKQIREQSDLLYKLQLRNSELEHQVLDLQNSLDAIDEKARTDLGLVAPDEIFLQVVPISPDAESVDEENLP